MRELPPDLRPWTLRYPGWCRISGEELLVGDDAFWSQSRHYVYSKETVRYLRAHEEFIADQAAGRGDGIPPVPPTGSQGEDLSHQRQWTRLCTYLRSSVLAEAADSLAPFAHQNRWFLQDGGDAGLVTGSADDVEAPEFLHRMLVELEDRRSFI